MLHIHSHNLPGPQHDAINYDLALAVRLATAKGIAVPDLGLRLICLSGGEGQDAQMPHNLPVPAPNPPVSFAERCDWEVARQTFEILPGAQGELWVVGGAPVGVQYGVGEVLSCLLGVIWAGLDEERDTLFGPTKSLPMGPQKPVMPLRARDGSPPPGQSVPAFLRWMGRNRYNLWRRASNWFMKAGEPYRQDCLTGCRARSILLTLGDHAIDYFLPDDAFDQHPEWFGLRDGKRTKKCVVHIPDCPHLDAELPTQPCFSNEALTDFLTDRIAAHVAEFSDCAIFGLWPHDGVNNWCQCNKCVQKTPYEHMYWMAMKLLPKLPATMPIELIAYSNLLNPPTGPLPKSDRTFTMLCPYLRVYRHRFYEPFDGPHETGRLYPAPDRINPLDEREYGILFHDWQKVCDQTGSVLAIFEYGAHFYDETRRSDRTRFLYHPQPELIADEVEWYVKREVRVFYICSAFRGWPDEFVEIMLAHTLWHGQAGLAQAERAFYQAALGDLGAPVREVLSKIAQALFEPASPTELLDRLQALLSRIPEDARTRRYHLWGQYIRLAKAARQAEVALDRDGMATLEEAVLAFFKANETNLKGVFNLPAYMRYAQTNQQRAQEAVAGVAGRNYVL
jgi:hypothetical protein